MRLTLAALIALVAVTPALAAGKPKGEEAGAVGQYVDLVPLALPVIANGMVRNYIYLRVRVNLASGVDAVKAREKEPHLRNALIYAGYRAPFTASDTWLKLDTAKLSASLSNEARTILGPKAVASVVVMSQDPQHISNVGRPG
jgi:hypothetical protein